MIPESARAGLIRLCRKVSGNRATLNDVNGEFRGLRQPRPGVVLTEIGLDHTPEQMAKTLLAFVIAPMLANLVLDQLSPEPVRHNPNLEWAMGEPRACQCSMCSTAQREALESFGRQLAQAVLADPVNRVEVSLTIAGWMRALR